MLFELSDMLLDNDVAFVNLRELSIGIDFENLHQKGVSFVCEPFFRSLLTCIFHRKLKDLKNRTRIQIPLRKGRYMMGTSDETKSLAYGQVFIQYSAEPHHPMISVKTVLGKVVVTKNPCFHPGDLRILEAVDIPGLRHMVDCIVFPQRGSRPHPNEMSGSDLDGDEYFVCWDERLHSIENQNPMDFPKAKKKSLESDITVPDIVEFVANYIQNDNLGIIANTHLALADYEPDGIFSSSCIELAKMHSDAVDFPKTGNAPSLQNFKSPEKYPDFMMKRDKLQYTSSEIIGKLYRQCRFLLPKAQNQAFKNDFGECDIPFLPLSQRDIENAILQRNVYNESILQIMNAYGIENEAEACTGLVESARSKRGCLKDEAYNVEKAIRSQISVLFERTKTEFFKEFGVENLSVLESISISRKALAWYTVTYEDRFRTSKQLLSFPWVVADVICQMKLKLLQTNAFDKIDQSLQTKIKSSESDQKRTVRTIKKLRRVIQTNIPKTKKYKYLFEHEVVSTNCCNEFLGVEREDLKIFIRYMERHQDHSFDFEHDLIKKGVLCFLIKISSNEKVFVSFVTDERIKQLCGTLNDFLHKSHELRYVAQTLFENLRETADDRRPIDINEWIFTLMLLEESAKQHVDLNRLSLGIFSKLLICCLRNARGFVENCVRSLCLPKPLKQRLLRNKKNIVHMCLQKYVEIAESLNVVSLSHAQGFEHETSESFLLPTESWSTIEYASIYARFKMMKISGADVYFHNVSFGKQQGLQMEAVGTVSQLSRLGKIVYDLSEKSKSLQSARNGRLSINGTFSILFEGASDSFDILNLDIYHGPCQGKHSNVAKYIPQLMDPNCSGSYGRDAFHDMFMSQWRIVQSEYDSIFHGDLCIVHALGYFYIMDIQHSALSISALNQYLSSYQERLENQRSRTKVPYSFSFLPINSNLENITEILSEHFLKVETEKRVKVRLGKLGMCDLDENQSFLQWNAPEIKWFIGQIICKRKKRFRNRTSVRCKMQSYRNLNQKAIQRMEGYEHFVDRISNGSLCEKDGNVYIIKDNNVKYIREKEITVYSNINLNFENETWRSIRVEMSQFVNMR
ncbi:uncharacterized protein LOC128178957 [Crassostrea angulata]|uniref:uncharacterized protein LOC128178957 n=1 Tax=Magallana angulata TaxID=2784310 RepID=UPI0022B18C56|nr:uncharacterized protein LOC128178957 [Crassostrea angulata]